MVHNLCIGLVWDNNNRLRRNVCTAAFHNTEARIVETAHLPLMLLWVVAINWSLTLGVLFVMEVCLMTVFSLLFVSFQSTKDKLSFLLTREIDFLGGSMRWNKLSLLARQVSARPKGICFVSFFFFQCLHHPWAPDLLFHLPQRKLVRNHFLFAAISCFSFGCARFSLSLIVWLLCLARLFSFQSLCFGILYSQKIWLFGASTSQTPN